MAALSGSKSYEFKALFSVIHAALRARNAAGGGEEMLRLRTYEKLQNLVRAGQVKKTGKKYKGVAKALLLLSESLKELPEERSVLFPQARRSLPNPYKGDGRSKSGKSSRRIKGSVLGNVQKG